MPGVLEGVTIIELAGIGPAPFCGMMLADHGARVIRVDRAGAADAAGRDVLSRNRERIEADLKTPEGIAQVRELAKGADGIIEGFRPGVMERLGLGPDVLLGDNPKLVFGLTVLPGATATFLPSISRFSIMCTPARGTACGRYGAGILRGSAG